LGKILCYFYNEMADWEIIFACNILSFDLGLYNKELITIANNNLIISKAGIHYKPHILINNFINLNDIDGLLIPGGWQYEYDADLIKLIKSLYYSNKLIAAICAGPIFLARAGILEKVKYTTTLCEDYFIVNQENDPFPRKNFINSDLVRDKNVITAKYNAFIGFTVECCDWFGLFKSNAEKKNKFKHFKDIKKYLL